MFHSFHLLPICFFFVSDSIDHTGYPPAFDDHLAPPPLTPLQPSQDGATDGGAHLQTSHEAAASDGRARPANSDISITNSATSSARDVDANCFSKDASDGATHLHAVHRHAHLSNVRTHPYQHLSHHPLAPAAHPPPPPHLANLYSRQNVIAGPPSPRLTPSPPHANSQRFVYPPPHPYTDVTSLHLNG